VGTRDGSNIVNPKTKIMANCHELFRTFNDEITIHSSKRSRLKNSKENLRSRIRKHFRENHPDYEPKFYIQGSYKMKTIIRTKDDICDLDDGVYFFREPNVSSTTLQGWIWDAVDGCTETPAQHRRKCIRSIFAADYEIDMPVYFKVENEQYKIAIRNEGWRNDDPKAMVDWFNQQKGRQQYLVDVVKYLKAWRDFKDLKPSGLSLTILASRSKGSLIYGERDDINLSDTLKEIKKALDYSFNCVVPVDPGDNLFADYDTDQKANFLNALKDFITDADVALREENHQKASKLWRKHLGSRFPLGEDKKETDNQNSKIIVGIGKSSPYAL
jgi:glycosidase